MIKFISRAFGVEVNAGKAATLMKNTMRAVEYNGEKNAICVYNDGNAFYATGGKCSHYGAPLVMGGFSSGKVYCPWHCACFDIKSGVKATSPAVQDIGSYKTTVNSDGDLIVSLPEDVKEPAAYINTGLVKRDPSNNQQFIIIGGGAAGLTCAEALRKNNFTGSIKILTNEDINPYDRVTLSKNFRMNALKTTVRADSFYTDFDIEVLKQTPAKAINIKAKTVITENGSINYDKILIASGCKARVLKGFEGLSNVCTIRSVSDHIKIKPLVESSKRIVIVGGSFLGLEAANAIKNTWADKEVTIIEAEKVPLEKIMGRTIGGLLKRRLEDKGVVFLTDKIATKIQTHDNKATSLDYNSGSIACDMILLASGSEINTSFIPQELLNTDKSVRVNALMQTDDPNIFAAGDIANYYSIYSGTSIRSEHWTVAQDQGITAGLNMLGLGKPYITVPFFWSNQAVNIQFVGTSGEPGFTESKDLGGKDEGHITYFFNGNKTVGVGIGNWFGASIIFSSLFQKGLVPNKSQILGGKKFEDLKEDFKRYA